MDTTLDRRVVTMSDDGRVSLASDRQANWTLFVAGDACLDPDRPDDPLLATHAATPAFLAEAGFDVATMASNHLLDYGPAGMRATVDACEEAGLETAGVGEDRTTAFEL